MDGKVISSSLIVADRGGEHTLLACAPRCKCSLSLPIPSVYNAGTSLLGLPKLGAQTQGTKLVSNAGAMSTWEGSASLTSSQVSLGLRKGALMIALDRGTV